MTQNLLPPYQSGQVPTVQNPEVSLYHAPDGVTYVAQRSTSGQITFTPVTAIAVPHPPVTQIQPQYEDRYQRGRDPLVTILLVLGAVLGVCLLFGLFGFLAGRSGRETVMVPRGPICDTRRTEFLIWSRYEKDCH